MRAECAQGNLGDVQVFGVSRGFPMDFCFTESGLTRKIYEGALATASVESGDKRGGQAPRVLVAMPKEAERLVCEEHELPDARLLCSYVCLSALGGSTFRQSEGIGPRTLVEQASGWMLGVSRANATDPTKRSKRDR